MDGRDRAAGEAIFPERAIPSRRERKRHSVPAGGKWSGAARAPDAPAAAKPDAVGVRPDAAGALDAAAARPDAAGAPDAAVARPDAVGIRPDAASARTNAATVLDTSARRREADRVGQKTLPGRRRTRKAVDRERRHEADKRRRRVVAMAVLVTLLVLAGLQSADTGTRALQGLPPRRPALWRVTAGLRAPFVTVELFGFAWPQGAGGSRSEPGSAAP